MDGIIEIKLISKYYRLECSQLENVAKAKTGKIENKETLTDEAPLHLLSK